MAPVNNRKARRKARVKLIFRQWQLVGSTHWCDHNLLEIWAYTEFILNFFKTIAYHYMVQSELTAYMVIFWFYCSLLFSPVAKKKSLFDDKPVEIQELTYIINQDIQGLNKQIAQLQQVARSHPNARHVQSHSNSVVVSLQVGASVHRYTWVWFFRKMVKFKFVQVLW